MGGWVALTSLIRIVLVAGAVYPAMPSLTLGGPASVIRGGTAAAVLFMAISVIKLMHGRQMQARRLIRAGEAAPSAACARSIIGLTPLHPRQIGRQPSPPRVDREEPLARVVAQRKIGRGEGRGEQPRRPRAAALA